MPIREIRGSHPLSQHAPFYHSLFSISNFHPPPRPTRQRRNPIPAWGIAPGLTHKLDSAPAGAPAPLPTRPPLNKQAAGSGLLSVLQLSLAHGVREARPSNTPTSQQASPPAHPCQFVKSVVPTPSPNTPPSTIHYFQFSISTPAPSYAPTAQPQSSPGHRPRSNTQRRHRPGRGAKPSPHTPPPNKQAAGSVLLSALQLSLARSARGTPFQRAHFPTRIPTCPSVPIREIRGSNPLSQHAPFYYSLFSIFNFHPPASYAPTAQPHTSLGHRPRSNTQTRHRPGRGAKPSPHTPTSLSPSLFVRTTFRRSPSAAASCHTPRKQHTASPTVTRTTQKPELLIEPQRPRIPPHHFRLHQGKTIPFRPPQHRHQQFPRHRPATNLRRHPHLQQLTDLRLILITIKRHHPNRPVRNRHKRRPIRSRRPRIRLLRPALITPPQRILIPRKERPRRLPERLQSHRPIQLPLSRLEATRDSHHENYDPRSMKEAIAPIQNNVGALLRSPMLRNIFGQIRTERSEIASREAARRANPP